MRTKKASPSTYRVYIAKMRAGYPTFRKEWALRVNTVLNYSDARNVGITLMAVIGQIGIQIKRAEQASTLPEIATALEDIVKAPHRLSSTYGTLIRLVPDRKTARLISDLSHALDDNVGQYARRALEAVKQEIAAPGIGDSVSRLVRLTEAVAKLFRQLEKQLPLARSTEDMKQQDLLKWQIAATNYELYEPLVKLQSRLSGNAPVDPAVLAPLLRRISAKSILNDIRPLVSQYPELRYIINRLTVIDTQLAIIKRDIGG